MFVRCSRKEAALRKEPHRCPWKLLNKILEKFPRKSSFLIKLQVLKMNSFTSIFQGFNLVHDFWEDCFSKPKLLLAVNRQIYLNTSIGISKIYVPSPLARHSFLHKTTTSGVKIRLALKKIMILNIPRF